MVFTCVWLFIYLSMINRFDLGEGVINFIIYYLFIPAIISFGFLGIEILIKKGRRWEEAV